ncbi:MAG: hypothetical protein H0W45_02190 [Acidobacteria bacterium]|nr:hypothetical protein [Acidobacteriota bacterium]
MYAKVEALNSCEAATRFGGKEFTTFLLEAELETSTAAPRLDFATFFLNQT